MSQRITKVKKKTAGGFTEAIPIGAKAQNITLRDGTVLQDVVQELQTGRAGHADLTQAEYDALSPAQKNDGTVYFVSDGTAAGRIDATAVHYNDTTGTLNSNYVQGAIDTLATNKVNYTDIINNLTSTNTGAALSAAQGKVLQDQITTLDGNVTSLLPLLGKQSNMLSNVDLNTLLEAGVYQIGNPDLITNIPSETYGFLRVTHARSYIYQEYYELSSSYAVYQRRSINSGASFGAWVKRPTQTDINNAQSSINNLTNNAFKNMGIYNDDLNKTDITPGFYSISTTATNVPGNMTWCNFLQFGAYKGQIVFGSAWMYYRQYIGNPSAWTDWKKIALYDSGAPIIKMKYITAAMPANANHTGSISASIDSGYQFMGWCYCASVSWVGHIYPAANTASTTFWTTSATSTSNRNFNAFYLLRKT